eukprot:TRINITY_DN22708_c0_g1_i5.p1 TRINITY_DN22708_c0_g1~~TRINITY_DN22708_c0_g1_i5.p1  ORF type:complete len:116 (-),score=3.66 TRINITY_DN22708_c0_g1_i5:454-801(-)
MFVQPPGAHMSQHMPEASNRRCLEDRCKPWLQARVQRSGVDYGLQPSGVAFGLQHQARRASRMEPPRPLGLPPYRGLLLFQRPSGERRRQRSLQKQPAATLAERNLLVQRKLQQL